MIATSLEESTSAERHQSVNGDCTSPGRATIETASTVADRSPRLQGAAGLVAHGQNEYVTSIIRRRTGLAGLLGDLSKTSQPAQPVLHLFRRFDATVACWGAEVSDPLTCVFILGCHADELPEPLLTVGRGVFAQLRGRDDAAADLQGHEAVVDLG